MRKTLTRRDFVRAGAVAQPGARGDHSDSVRCEPDRLTRGTDAAAVGAYAPLGDEACARLRALTRPWSRAIVDGGLLT